MGSAFGTTDGAAGVAFSAAANGAGASHGSQAFQFDSLNASNTRLISSISADLNGNFLLTAGQSTASVAAENPFTATQGLTANSPSSGGGAAATINGAADVILGSGQSLYLAPADDTAGNYIEYGVNAARTGLIWGIQDNGTATFPEICLGSSCVTAWPVNIQVGTVSSSSGTTTTAHTFGTAFSSTPNCTASPYSNSGAWYFSTLPSTTSSGVITYASSGAQTFSIQCVGADGAW